MAMQACRNEYGNMMRLLTWVGLGWGWLDPLDKQSLEVPRSLGLTPASSNVRNHESTRTQVVENFGLAAQCGKNMGSCEDQATLAGLVLVNFE